MSSCEIINVINSIFGKTNYKFQESIMSDSITDFWLRWHITLGNFTRQYISATHFLLRKKGLKNLLAFTISTIISLYLLVYGIRLVLGIFILESILQLLHYSRKHVFSNHLKRIYQNKCRIISIAYSQFFIILGYTFVIDDLKNVIIHL